MVASMQMDAFLAVQAVNPDLAQPTFDTHKKKAEGPAGDQLATEESPAKQFATSVVKIEKNLEDSGWNPDHKKGY
ncbi:hypothetical protein EYC80_002121 [Monilinia laxa]|uniref:Uncharacterized protein n=1 Tax=Monilinia laxa TaxID=61186 RepID=A0A5N6K2V9_MONLA|nr:hypothetical protein EYC80_002121 [Monilinia laxa]